MNELEFIRQQVSTERSHMAAVRSACAAALAQQADAGRDADFLLACVDYLVFIVGRFNSQDQAHCDRLRARVPAADVRSHAVIDDLAQTLAASRKAIEALAVAGRARASGSGDELALVAALRSYLSFYASVLASRRHVIQHLFEVHYGIADWRATSAVDADAILEERARYGRVAERLPDGIVLAERGSESGAPARAQLGGAPDAPRPTSGA